MWEIYFTLPILFSKEECDALLNNNLKKYNSKWGTWVIYFMLPILFSKKECDALLNNIEQVSPKFSIS